MAKEKKVKATVKADKVAKDVKEIKAVKADAVDAKSEKAKEKAIAKTKAEIAKNLKTVIANLVKERKPVADNLDRLKKALDSNNALREDKNHLQLLNVQKAAMELYVQVLNDRMEYLSKVLEGVSAK